MSTVQLNFWLMPIGDFDTYNVLRKEISNFEKKYPKIKIEPTIIPWSHVWDRLVNYHKHRGELAPSDVIQVGTTWASTLSYLGVLQKISKYFSKDLIDDIIPALKDSSRSPESGELMCMPWLADIRMLYYREDLLKKHNYSKNDLQDIESFKKVCMSIQKSRKSDKDPMAYRLSGSTETVLIHDLAPWIWGMGGTFLSHDKKSITLDSDKARKGIHWYFDLVNSLYGKQHEKNMYGIMPSGTFFSGNYAMEIIGKSPLNSIANLKHSDYSHEVAKSYKTTPIPAGPNGSVPFIGGSSLAIPKWSRHPEEAAEWIRFLISSKSQLRHGYNIGIFPSRVSLLKKYFKEYSNDYEVIKTTLENGRSLPNSPLLGTLERIINAFSDRVLKAIKFGKYSNKYLDEEITQAALEANYIFSMYV
ncbi:MAG: extracellular solute-binding protein [Spirochaetes bacterium]|nr:extracellular solute-binding protein [Spirochaetota bacterium]